MTTTTAETYNRELNAWHLELAMLGDLIDHILAEVEGPDWLTSSAHVAQVQLAHLVKTCPFPPR